ncbi:hypothetical protein [Salinibacter sp.]|uniref:hypothetical protein n=1 Tax=Salinibacter sp. TaxID=2065818 RepID=UPI0021E7E321|nr:hypothetical protein [Salinibacter sp.]
MDEQDGADAASTLSSYPEGARWLLGTQVGNFIASDGWVENRDNEHDRTIATTLTEDISGEDRTSIAIESMPYDLPDGHELFIQTGDSSSPPLTKNENGEIEDGIFAYVDGGVSEGDTSISIDDGNGNPVTVTASKGDRVLSDFQSLWMTHAREQTKAAMQTFMTGFVNNGGELDGIALDTELKIEATKGIKHDPRWDDASKGVDGVSFKQKLSPYTIDEVMSGNSDARGKWSREIQHRAQVEALNEAVLSPIQEDFPDAKASDWNDNKVTESEAQNALNTDGKATYQPHIFGTHGNYGLYASMRNMTIKAPTNISDDLPHGLAGTPMETLAWQVKFMRTMVRENNGAVQPWLPFFNCCGGGFYFGTVTENYHREHWIQMALHTDPKVPVLYFNPTSASTDEKDLDANDWVGEINNAVERETWSSVTSTDISYVTDLIATAVDLPDKRLWRISVGRADAYDDRPITVNVSNGDTFTIPGGEVGAWYESGLNETPTFSYTHPPLDNLLPSDDFVDFTSDVWSGGGSVSGGKSDPDGGSNAYRMKGGWISDSIPLESEKEYTFSVWHRRAGYDSKFIIHPANDLSSQLGAFNSNPGPWGDANWRRGRTIFEVPPDVDSVVIEVVAPTYNFSNHYMYHPMINEGQLEGPYEHPDESAQTSQSLSLQAGGNLVSAAVQPSDPDLEAVFGNATSALAQVETEDGQVFDPDDGTDEIGTWEATEAYTIYAETPTSFAVEGTALDSASVSLDKGWNWLPYLDSTSIAIDQALQPIENDLVMVKDETGRVYHPGQGTTQIDSLTPGAAYKIYVESPVTLNYPLQ